MLFVSRRATITTARGNSRGCVSASSDVSEWRRLKLIDQDSRRPRTSKSMIRAARSLRLPTPLHLTGYSLPSLPGVIIVVVLVTDVT